MIGEVTEFFLCLDALGDVAVNAAIAHKPAVVVEDRHAAGFKHHAAAVLAEVDVLQPLERPARRRDVGELLADFRRLVRRHEIERRFADDLIRRVAQQVFDLGAGVGVNAVRIHFPDPVARGFDQRAQALPRCPPALPLPARIPCCGRGARSPFRRRRPRAVRSVAPVGQTGARIEFALAQPRRRAADTSARILRSTKTSPPAQATPSIKEHHERERDQVAREGCGRPRQRPWPAGMPTLTCT